MRKLALVLLFALPLFGFEVRSDKYAMSVVIEQGEDLDVYMVRVSDTKTNAIVAVTDVTRNRDGLPIEKSVVAGNQTLLITLYENLGRLAADLDIMEAGGIVDSLHGTWMVEPAPNEPLRVGGDVKAPVVEHRVDPEYTAEAKDARISGVVIVELEIDTAGKVVDAKVLKPLPMGLDEKALEAVKQWKFRPATLKGEPVAVYFVITVNFQNED